MTCGGKEGLEEIEERRDEETCVNRDLDSYMNLGKEERIIKRQKSQLLDRAPRKARINRSQFSCNWRKMCGFGLKERLD